MTEQDIDRAVKARLGQQFNAVVYDSAYDFVALDGDACVGLVWEQGTCRQRYSFIAFKGVVTLGQVGEYCTGDDEPLHDGLYRLWTLHEGVWGDCGEGPWEEYDEAERFADAECGVPWAVKLEGEFVAWMNPMRAPISSSPYC